MIVPTPFPDKPTPVFQAITPTVRYPGRISRLLSATVLVSMVCYMASSFETTGLVSIVCYVASSFETTGLVSMVCYVASSFETTGLVSIVCYVASSFETTGLVKEGFGNQINLCRDRGLNPGLPAQKSDTLPLDHQSANALVVLSPTAEDGEIEVRISMICLLLAALTVSCLAQDGAVTELQAAGTTAEDVSTSSVKGSSVAETSEGGPRGGSSDAEKSPSLISIPPISLSLG
uniref:Uncharacterized protein n=1 Tax=Timema bartmani TaxID=61472 RepID=A0A7R9EPY6_9NEOP|nr:unnamed protein product [Timema bartmani]